MTSPTPQSDAPDPPFWVDFGFNLKYIFTIILLHFGILFCVVFTSQAQWRIRSFAAFWIFCLFLLGRARPPIYATAALFAETIDQPVNMSAKEKILPCSINPIRDSRTPAMRQEALETKFEITSIEYFDFSSNQ